MQPILNLKAKMKKAPDIFYMYAKKATVLSRTSAYHIIFSLSTPRVDLPSNHYRMPVLPRIKLPVHSDFVCTENHYLHAKIAYSQSVGVIWLVNKKFHWLRPKLRPSITRPWQRARPAITRGSCVFNAHEHHVSRDASVRKRNVRKWNLRTWWTPRDEFGFLDWNIYFHKGCNYSNETNEMM